MNSKNVFTVLRELESSKLYFPGIGYDDNYLSIEARSILSIKELDKIIQFQLSKIFSLEFVDYIRSAPYPPLGVCKQELKLWDESEHLVNYTICYRMISKSNDGELFVPAKWATEGILKENMVVAAIDLANNCPDCKDGFYYPLFGDPADHNGFGYAAAFQLFNPRTRPSYRTGKEDVGMLS